MKKKKNKWKQRPGSNHTKKHNRFVCIYYNIYIYLLFCLCFQNYPKNSQLTHRYPRPRLEHGDLVKRKSRPSRYQASPKKGSCWISCLVFDGFWPRRLKSWGWSKRTSESCFGCRGMKVRLNITGLGLFFGVATGVAVILDAVAWLRSASSLGVLFEMSCRAAMAEWLNSQMICMSSLVCYGSPVAFSWPEAQPQG